MKKAYSGQEGRVSMVRTLKETLSFKCWQGIFGKDVPTALEDRNNRENDLAERM